MNKKPKTFVVVNPKAGGDLAVRGWSQLSKKLREKIGDFDFRETESMGHGRVLAREAARSGYTLVVAYGGDGTIHEVVNGLYDAKDSHNVPALGILCVGTGGDLIRTLGIPKSLNRQIDILAGEKTCRIDLGKMEYTHSSGQKENRVFVNIADAGIGADVVKSVARSRSLFGRKLAYGIETLRRFIAWQSKKIKITAEDIPPDFWPEKPLSVVIANGKYFGGGMPIAPGADIHDGYFDLVVIGELNPWMAGGVLPLLYTKKLNWLPQVRTARVRSLTLESSAPVYLDIDGEPIGALPAKFEVIPQAMTVKGSV